MIAKKIMNDPENRKRNSELSLKRFEDPTERKKLSDGRIRKLLENSKYAIEYIVSYYGEEFLNGHPRIDFPKYCEIFEEVKPRVRAFFNYTCTKCGKHESENGRLLSTHHVFYVKEACCLSDQDGYWTNLNAIDHKEQDYFIGNNPNYFALLCTKCHGETGGNYERRKNNADGLKNLIDDKFGGRCYFSESEMVENGYIKLSRTEWKKI
jgi:hypothetical protein